jgi:hypothetical protein
MMFDIISMFIDNELSLNDKIEFVSKVHGDRAFRDQTIEFLEQEKFIRSDVVKRVPQVKFGPKKRFIMPLWRPVAGLTAALAVTLIILLFSVPSEIAVRTPYRFIIYQPDVSQAEITGSFTKWQNLPMKRAGNMGYWEITLDIPKGEHRFVYILDGHQRLSDPTLRGREQDDFGGENSILSI